MRKIIGLAILLAVGAVASQATVVLTFSGFQQPYETILNYYNGGFGGSGSGPGPNYGVVFGADALALPNGTGSNVCCEPGGSTGSMIFLTGADVMNVAAGFTTGFSFYYAAPYYTGSVQVFSGPDGTGTQLASLFLNPNGSFCGSLTYSCWTPIGVTFSGTAESAVFAGTANYIAFSNVTLGSANPGTPEPGTLIMFGSGVLGLAGVIRRKLTL
jgi:hypothetical protein